MPILFEISHLWGSDLDTGPSGDIAIVSGANRTTERVIRRLLTRAAGDGVSADYAWHPNYGAGLGQRIGQVLDIRGLQAVVFSQLLLEPSVARIPLPRVTVAALPGNNGAVISATYIDKTGTTQNFSFNLAS